MKLIISNVSGVPIYEQIKQQIKAAILSGELQAEETLPSLRTLAKDLKISVLTVTKAYTELEQEGFVKNVQGRGCFVMGSGSELIKEQLICKVENNLTEAIKAAKSWQIYKSFSSYGLFQEPISMIFPSGSAIKQVRCPHGLVVGSNKDVAPCATAF